MSMAMIRPAPEEPQSRAPAARLTPLDAAVARVESAEDFPALAAQIQQLMNILGDEDASAQKLANIVLLDYSLTLKLLQRANSYHFNRSGIPIVSITQAILMLGVQTIRDLATSIVVFEHYQRRSPCLRQVLMLSLLTASHAREVADRRSTTVKPEEAYVCGLFRNLGEVLVAAYFEKEYAAILRLLGEHQLTPNQACRKVMQFDFDDLACAVVRVWKMPDELEQVLVADGARPVTRSQTRTMVAFAHGLTNAVYRQEPDGTGAALQLVCQKHVSLDFKADEVRLILQAGIAATRETFAQARIHLDDLRLHRQMERALEQPEAVQHRDRGAARAERFELNKVALMMLEALLRGGRFDRVMLALDSHDLREVSGHLGLGEDIDTLISRFRFKTGVGGGPVGVALARRQELVLSRVWELLPEEDRLLQQLDAATCVILPLAFGDTRVGCLYVDHRRTAVQPPEQALALARRMRDALAETVSRHRADQAVRK
jgi:HD-like signal output (HDOD) protein